MLNQMLDFLPALQNSDYGLGITKIIDFIKGKPSIGHDGGIYGFLARMLYLPDYDVYISVTLNYMEEDSIETISKSLARLALNHL